MIPKLTCGHWVSPKILNRPVKITGILGCILVELHTGEALFAGTNEEDPMMKIVEVMGMPPRHMLDQSKVANRFFKRNESDQWVPREHRHRYLKPGTRTLSEVLSKPFARRHGERGHRNTVFNLGPFGPS